MLAWDKRKKTLVVLEVRGAGARTFSPALTLPWDKQLRLERLARQLVQAGRRPVRLEFLVVSGTLPQAGWKSWIAKWALRLRPEWLGLSLRSYSFGPLTY